ncbi:hypothetical protein F5884DRAFT_817328 [Xylogone sp. PMI_703]|nr:hypothetical protein F5884DRAFT_817328 [Xylogone sp. PMI_703]
MLRRYKSVPEAHLKTFEWMFEDSSSSTAANKPGRAGSGKPTLMRYIYDHEQTHTLLQSWANPLPLTIASCFFWNSGAIEQALQTGLLRFLLYSILQEHRDLIPIVLPWHWSRCHSELTSKIKGGSAFVTRNFWPLSKLLGAFHLHFNIYLFIDGIDEYNGDIEELCQLYTISSSNHIKVCAPSRPVPVIENIYQTFPKVRLQDLTVQDIEFYAKER